LRFSYIVVYSILLLLFFIVLLLSIQSVDVDMWG